MQFLANSILHVEFRDDTWLMLHTLECAPPLAAASPPQPVVLPSTLPATHGTLPRRQSLNFVCPARAAARSTDNDQELSFEELLPLDLFKLSDPVAVKNSLWRP